MKVFSRQISPFFISVIAVIAATVVTIILVAATSFNKLAFETSFYFVCYSIEDNAVSAGSVSNAVSSYGGAGYVLEYRGNYYVTVSCYYEKRDAEKICDSLKRRNLECEVLKIQTKNYSLPPSADKNLYLGNFNTLLSLSTLAYDCANNLDTGEYGQGNAKTVINDIKTGLKGLLNANSSNCFSQPLKRLIALSNETENGIIHSKDLRTLQIAIADNIINIELR